MPVNMNTFWSNLGVVGGVSGATNQYDLFNGLIFDDGFVSSSQYDFFQHLNTNRYEFFKSYNSVDPNIVDEYTFFQNTSDPNIYNFNTFFEYAGEYIYSTPVTPTPTATQTSTPTPTATQTSTPTPTPTLTPTPSSIVYDVDAQAFFDRVTSAGGSLTLTEKTATNTLVLNLKSNNIWSKMRAIYPFVGSSSSSCSQNLVSSSYTASFNGGWTFDMSGVTSNGTNGYMNTTLNTLSVYGTSFNNHWSAYYRTDRADDGYIGVATSTLSNAIAAHIAYTNGITYNDNRGRNSIDTSTYGNSKAFHVSSLLSTTNQKMYRDGVLKMDGAANAGSIIPNLSFYFSACNFNGTAVNFSNRQMAFASLGDGLNGTEVSNFNTAVTSFQTTLGRQN